MDVDADAKVDTHVEGVEVDMTADRPPTATRTRGARRILFRLPDWLLQKLT